MNVEVKKTIIIELSKTEVFAIKVFLEDALIEMKGQTDNFTKPVKNLIDSLEACDL